MQLQAKNNKGFTILETVVVLCLVGIISAIAYPSFDKWNKSRKVQSDLFKVVNMFDNINSQVQRGLYSFVQVYILSEDTEGTGNKLTIVTRGMSANTLADNIATRTEFRDAQERCYLDTDEWDDDGTRTDRPEVSSVEFDNITTDFYGEEGICFSKDGRWYSTSEHFEGQNSFELLGQGGFCDRPDRNGGNPCDYRIVWSRFGNIKLEKWNAGKGEDGGWVAQ